MPVQDAPTKGMAHPIDPLQPAQFHRLWTGTRFAISLLRRCAASRKWGTAARSSRETRDAIRRGVQDEQPSAFF